MNRQGVLSNKTFLAIMEDTAGEHSAFMHITFSDIVKDNLTWVILGWNLKVLKRPGEDENIRVQKGIEWENQIRLLFFVHISPFVH